MLFRAVPILGSLFEIAAVGLCGVLTAGNPACALVAAAATSFVAGVTSGNLAYALRSGLIAGATAAAFYVVGGITNVLQDIPFFDAHVAPAFGTSAYAFQVAGHALVGCASAIASGGKCGPGALAAGVTSAAGPFINKNNFAVNVASNAALGGLASMAGGGKFANGAVTAAFGYLFNACGQDPHGCLKAGLASGAAMGVYEGAPLVVGGPVGAAIGGLILITDTVIGGVIGFASDIIGDEWLNNISESRKSDKEAATNIPSWAKGDRPAPGESAADYADRKMKGQYGDEWRDTESTGPGSEYSKIKKNAVRRR